MADSPEQMRRKKDNDLVFFDNLLSFTLSICE